MTSSYSRDPRVPPAQVGHLGKHGRVAAHGPVGLPPAERPKKPPVDAGPTYDDFLEHDEADDRLPGKTG